MGLQSLGSTGQVEGIRVSVQQVLEGLQGGLAGLEGKKRVLGIRVFSFLSRPRHPHPLSPPGARRSEREPVLALPKDPIHKGPCQYTRPAGHVSGQWGLPTSVVFPVVRSPPCPSLLLSLTDPTLLSSCSSALLNKALLWMAAMASGCNCLMAWQASLRG